jgi:tyrosinase
LSVSQPRVRRSLKELQDDYTSGNKNPLENLWRAWKAIQERPSEDPCSFFTLAGYHGEPFRGAGWGSSQYWGGYCNHGNVLFPIWHRLYLLKLEEALQSIPGCEDVMLPYWDETSQESLDHGIPWALTQQYVELDGCTIDNPLRSFRLTANIRDHITNDVADYSKPKGYETQRYPRSGLVGPTDLDITEEHNRNFDNYDECVRLLNHNVRDWLAGFVEIDGQKTALGQVVDKYQQCLAAPNYTVFSNTTSAAEWNVNHERLVVSLESPHNSIHLAVGGFEVPGQDRSSPISGANGDMGENNTAGFDPIFFFHHCFVDYAFWQWQKRHHQVDSVDIIAEYPGTNSVDGQGPAPGVAPNSWLDLDSPLNPFRKSGGQPFTSRDCLDIEGQLGYTYGPGSLSKHAAAAVAAPAPATGKVVSVTGINRALVRGSFLVSVFGNVNGRQVHLGTEAVLSRWNVLYCANCQTHLDVNTFVNVATSGTAAMADVPVTQLAEPTTYEYTVITRHGEMSSSDPQSYEAVAMWADPSTEPSPLARARLEVR